MKWSAFALAALFAVLIAAAYAPQAHAQSAPGNSCSTTGNWTESMTSPGGNVFNGMFCNTGGTYTGIINFRSNGNVGIGTIAPATALDVIGAARLGYASTTCSSTIAGAIRYNSATPALEYCNGTAWQQVASQTPGSTTNVTASGPPVSANIYTPSSVTCNFTPAYGSCSIVNNGVFPPNGTGTSGSNCVSLYNPTTASSIQFIYYDLGSVKTIGNVYIVISNNYVANGTGISFSSDNVSYTNSISITPSLFNGITTQYFTYALNPIVTARYIRFNNTGGQNNNSNNSYQYSCQFAVGP